MARRRDDSAPRYGAEEARETLRKLLGDARTLFLKVQTTGLGDDARVLTLTLMTPDRHWTQRMVNPQMALTEDTVRYTGVTQDDVDGWDIWANGVADDLPGLIYGHVVAGWNVWFDIKAVRREQARCGAPDPVEAADRDGRRLVMPVDAMELASAAMGRESRFWKLADALGHPAPISPVDYLESVIGLLEGVCRG